MLDDGASDQVRRLWRDLMLAPNGFVRPGVVVVAAPDHRAAPPGWVGIVDLAGSVVVAAPPELVATLRLRVSAVESVHSLTDGAAIHGVLRTVDEILGPAVLFYGNGMSVEQRHEVVGPLPLGDVRVQAVLDDAAPDEVDESGMVDTTSGVWLTLDDDGMPAALSGWREWPHAIAHVSVLAAATHRGRGFAVASSATALAAASAAGLLPQWRAAADERCVMALAERLGLHRVGRQLSVRLRTDRHRMVCGHGRCGGAWQYSVPSVVRSRYGCC